jgi:chromatin segregation and condensation protein Rec8/ScpA/Scc1 (kleisin family)
MSTDQQLNIASANEFQIKLDNFSGPFDLLLSLIDEKQIDMIQKNEIQPLMDSFVEAIKKVQAQ